MSAANDYSRLRGAVPQTAMANDGDARMRYYQDPRNWFKRFRGEWPEPQPIEVTPLPPKPWVDVVVVDGADGLTPDMLRVRPGVDS